MSEYIDIYIDTTTKVPEGATEFDYELFERFMSGGPWVAHSEYMKLKDDNAELQNDADLLRAMLSQVQTEKRCYMVENDKLREQVSSLVGRSFRTADKMSCLEDDNAKLRELATYALRHIIEFECEELDRETLIGKPCEDCADYGSSDCPKCMPRMFDVSGIGVDE